MTQARRQAERRRRLLMGALSAAAHVAAIAALFLVHADEPQTMEVETIPVTLVAPPKPPEPPAPPVESPKPTAAAKPPSVRVRQARAPPPQAEARPVAKAPSVDEVAELSDAQVAGASTAESGGAGGSGCNMARWLQSRLRGDPLVKSAMASAHASRPLLVWNGDWIRHGEEEGNGLAALREAIMWEVGFAPQACRAEPVHGLVLLSLADAPGGGRVALGRGEWRWTDLLSAHSR